MKMLKKRRCGIDVLCNKDLLIQVFEDTEAG